MWAWLEPVFRAGQTFPHDPAIDEAEAQLANASYVVAEHCRHQGIGSRLCHHFLETARPLGMSMPL